MDPRPPAPPVTITDGRGRTLDPVRSESVDDASDEPGALPRRGRRVTSLVLAAALGFGAATLLAEQRQRTLVGSPDGVLSLDLGPQEPSTYGDLVPYDDGLAVQATVLLRNTGPRVITLEAAALGATGFAADDVAGRQMSSGGSTSVRLLRKVRCDDLPARDPVGPLQVRARTGAGLRSTALRIDTQGFAGSARFAAAACGRSSPLESLITMDIPPISVVGGRAEVGFELSSASSSPLLVRSLQLHPELRLVALQDTDGAEVGLPLRLAPGDYDPPTPPMDGRGPVQRLVAVVELTDCAAPAAGTQDAPLFQATVTDRQGRSGPAELGAPSAGSIAWGDPTVVERLRDSACPAGAGG